MWVYEVQTGIGRCGSWLAHRESGVTADIMTLAKGLGGGMPIGACVGVSVVGELLQAGQHGTTFGGNPVAAAAGLAVTSVIEAEGLLAESRRLGEYLIARVRDLGHSAIREVRSRRLLIGIALAEPGVAAGEAKPGNHGLNQSVGPAGESSQEPGTDTGSVAKVVADQTADAQPPGPSGGNPGA